MDNTYSSTEIVLWQHTCYLQRLYCMKSYNILCDANIQLEDGASFRVHSAVLSVCSSFFRALFTSGNGINNLKDYSLYGIEASFLAPIIKHAYLQELEIKEDTVFDLLVTADYLCVSGVVQKCFNFLEECICPGNCIGILLFARTHMFVELEMMAWQYTTSHFPAVARFSTQLMAVSAAELSQLLSADELNARSEDMVWSCVLRWLNHRPTERRRHLSQLLTVVRLPLMDRRTFVSQVMDNPSVLADSECHPLVCSMFESFHRPEMWPLVTARPRLPHQLLFVTGGWINSALTNIVETYDTRANKWQQIPEVDPAGPRTCHTTAVLGYKIYILGGFNSTEYLSSCRCFNVITKIWFEVSPMNERRLSLSSAVLGGHIYVMGGSNGHLVQKSVERYNARFNQWSYVAPMNSKRLSAGATVLNGSIYIVGGFDGREYLRSAEVYDPITDQWTFITPMTIRRSAICCVTYHGYICVIGGSDGWSSFKCCERFIPATNSWIPLPNMRYSRSGFACAVADDNIYVIGGCSVNQNMTSVESFNDSTNVWLEVADLNFARYGISAIVVEDIPNIEDYVQRRDKDFTGSESI